MDGGQWAAWVAAGAGVAAVAGAFWLYYTSRRDPSKDLRLTAAQVIEYASSRTEILLAGLESDLAFLGPIHPDFIAECDEALGDIRAIPMFQLRPYELVASIIRARRAFQEVGRVAATMLPDPVPRRIETPDELDAAIARVELILKELALSIESLTSARHIISPPEHGAGNGEP